MLAKRINGNEFPFLISCFSTAISNEANFLIHFYSQQLNYESNSKNASKSTLLWDILTQINFAGKTQSMNQDCNHFELRQTCSTASWLRAMLSIVDSSRLEMLLFVDLAGSFEHVWLIQLSISTNFVHATLTVQHHFLVFFNYLWNCRSDSHINQCIQRLSLCHSDQYRNGRQRLNSSVSLTEMEHLKHIFDAQKLKCVLATN